MISKILEEVKSPFTDELIHDLIEKYITCGCDDNLFYNEINQLDNTDKSSYSPHTEALISQIYSQGISKSELWNYKFLYYNICVEIRDRNRYYTLIKGKEVRRWVTWDKHSGKS